VPPADSEHAHPPRGERFYYETRDVASLPAVLPRIEGPPCMLGPAWLRRIRWIAARRTRADCCWYHRVDWHAASETAILLAAQARAAGIPVEETAEAVASDGLPCELSGADLEAVQALLDVDTGIIIVDEKPDDPFINEGRHRITAMRDTGVRRTVTVCSELVDADGTRC
jgi:hypothetical protein